MQTVANGVDEIDWQQLLILMVKIKRTNLPSAKTLIIKTSNSEMFDVCIWAMHAIDECVRGVEKREL
jgi:hypothetical protein